MGYPQIRPGTDWWITRSRVRLTWEKNLHMKERRLCAAVFRRLPAAVPLVPLAVLQFRRRGLRDRRRAPYRLQAPGPRQSPRLWSLGLAVRPLLAAAWLQRPRDPAAAGSRLPARRRRRRRVRVAAETLWTQRARIGARSRRARRVAGLVVLELGSAGIHARRAVRGARRPRGARREAAARRRRSLARGARSSATSAISWPCPRCSG